MTANILSPFRKAKSQNHYICELMSADVRFVIQRCKLHTPYECQIFIKPLEDLNRALSRDPICFFSLMNFSSYLFVLKGRALCLP